MSKQIVNKSVSFNVLDPDQLEMKKYADKYPNFSGYIKRLIQRDMENGTKKAPATAVTNRSGATQQGFKSQNGAIKFVVEN
ncbi:hypothetical protein [Cytobacillus gottheilii]|uniref:Uncharacterized protein n=1 Tax=Cytobacillus gottheilii TaxID=859144 RepID=A0ABX8FG51_9BACI|nr:hypothetical protein [Cytobacillus gottheilii]QVY63006.1 hypothetical protein J1899_08180 [Cytobacillus gottheilii]